jgi:hypothetical protein
MPAEKEKGAVARLSMTTFLSIKKSAFSQDNTHETRYQPIKHHPRQKSPPTTHGQK